MEAKYLFFDVSQVPKELVQAYLPWCEDLKELRICLESMLRVSQIQQKQLEIFERMIVDKPRYISQSNITNMYGNVRPLRKPKVTTPFELIRIITQAENNSRKRVFIQ